VKRMLKLLFRTR